MYIFACLFESSNKKEKNSIYLDIKQNYKRITNSIQNDLSLII